ncbi:MAG TPA: VTT domain-containing protein [Edaphocola sp.]|nr:VTT domain-containing protein [Edaphocola sp.]
MDAIIQSLQHLLDPDWIMQNGGLYLVLLILFIETGIIFGFFLPGDPLLFISGMVIASATDTPYPFETPSFNLIFWISLFSVSTILGNNLGYWFGKRFGPYLLKRKDTWIFKKKHIYAAQEFYDKRGGFTIGIARFLPIVRTFAPIIAGMVKMDYKRFTTYNILGALIWVISITLLGFVLGKNPWVKENLEFVILGLVLVVTLPVIFKMLKKKGTTVPQ